MQQKKVTAVLPGLFMSKNGTLRFSLTFSSDGLYYISVTHGTFKMTLGGLPTYCTKKELNLLDTFISNGSPGYDVFLLALNTRIVIQQTLQKKIVSLCEHNFPVLGFVENVSTPQTCVLHAKNKYELEGSFKLPVYQPHQQWPIVDDAMCQVRSTNDANN